MCDSGSYPSHGRAAAPESSLYHPKPVRPSFASAFSAPPGSMFSSSASPSYATSNASSSASSSPSPPHPAAPAQLKPSHSLSSKHRPGKMSKKLSSSSNKRANVQVSLEVKVERSRGFHAFFVPLGRSMPPAPPSSPVFGQTADRPDRPAPVAASQTWPPPREGKQGEQTWVEDVQTMDID